MVTTKLPYLLQLTNSRLPAIVTGLLFSLIHIIATSIIFFIEDIPQTIGNFQVSIYFTFTFGYVIAITRVIHNSHTKSFSKLLEDHHFDDEKKAKWKIRFFSFRVMWPETLIASVVGILIAINYLNNVLGNDEGLTIYYYWRAFQIVLIWVLITHTTSLFVRNTTVMNQLSQEIKIDLLNLNKLMPLTKAGITSTLAFTGAYSFFIVEGLDAIDYDNPALFVMIPSIVFLLITPLKGIRKRIGKAKEQEIELVEKAIDGDMEALKDSRLNRNLHNLNAVDLINYKKLIENQLEIPINIPTASRFIFYLVIPFLTWIAASIVDKVIDYLIG